MIRYIGKSFKIMTLILLLAVSCLSVKVLFAESTNKLTFTTTNIEDVKSEDPLVVDLYAITTVTGNVVNAPTDGLYADLFASLDKTFADMKQDELSDFANKLSDIIFKEGSTIEKTTTASLGDNTVNNCTMYLGIVRNQKATKADYLKVETDDASVKHYSSWFNGNNNTYVFQPLLFFVQGDDLTIDLSKFELVMGGFVIEKTFDSFVSDSKATCVFLIQKKVGNEWVDIDVLSMTFENAGKMSKKYSGIPLGTIIKVIEKYPGSSYETSSEDTVEFTIDQSIGKDDEGYKTANFVNSHKTNKIRGYGALNTFKVESTGWTYKGNDLGTQGGGY